MWLPKMATRRNGGMWALLQNGDLDWFDPAKETYRFLTLSLLSYLFFKVKRW